MRNKDVLKKLKNLPDNTKEYVDQITNSTDIFEKPFIYDEELSTDTKKYVNVKSLSKRTCYKVKNDDDPLSLFIYYPIPNTTDKFNICSLMYPKKYNIYVSSVTDTKVLIYTENFEGAYCITATFGDTLESCSVTKKLYMPAVSNTSEFKPTKEYNLTSKKYVDEKFLTNDIETIVTITKNELDKCNNGGRGIVCSQNLNVLDHNASYIYYAYYGDKQIKMLYSSEFNQYAIDNMDKNENENIGLCVKLTDNRIFPFNSGVAAVKAYKFTNDLIIKRHRLLDPDKAVIKDTNKYVLITNDDTLIIKKNSITDIADATVTIDNLTGKFGTLVANDDGTYSYTLNTIMTDVETFTFKVNNVEQKLVIVPYREMKYDDSNGGITYEGTGWNIEEDKNHYKGKAHKSIVNGDALSFDFKGTGLSILSKCASDTDRIYYRLVGSGGGIIVTTTEKTYYQSNIFTKKNISYDTHNFSYKSFLNADKVCNYFDGFIIYDTLGTTLNDSIRKLYYGLDNTIGVLRTDIENARFSPTRLYDPTTKKYVDDLVKNSTAMCTDEEIDNMLNEVLGGDYSGN